MTTVNVDQSCGFSGRFHFYKKEFKLDNYKSVHCNISECGKQLPVTSVVLRPYIKRPTTIVTLFEIFVLKCVNFTFYSFMHISIQFRKWCLILSQIMDKIFQEDVFHTDLPVPSVFLCSLKNKELNVILFLFLFFLKFYETARC